MLLWGVLWIWYYAGSLEYDLVLLNETSSISMFIVLSVLVGAMGKSAQILFHVWLADAMEGDYILITKIVLLVIIGCLTYYMYNTHETKVLYSFLKQFLCLLSSKKIKCTNYQMEAITGLMISDGHIRNPNEKRRSTGNYRLEFTFKESVLDFVYWVKFEVLKDLCTLSNPVPYPKENPKQYWFSTRNLELFTLIVNDWYFIENDKRIKKLPDNAYLTQHFSLVSIAFMLMGDGYWDTDQKTIYICTENFQPDEVMRFIGFLKVQYGLEFTVKRRKLKTGYGLRMRLSSYDIPKLRLLIFKYMHPSMYYKLGI